MIIALVKVVNTILVWLSNLKSKFGMDSNMFFVYSILCYLLTTDSFWPKVTLLFTCVHLNKICYLALQHFVFFKLKKNLPKLQYMKMNVTSKGQLILKWPFRAFQISQKTNKIILRISALPLKRGQIRKVLCESQNKIIQLVVSSALIFWIDLFL